MDPPCEPLNVFVFKTGFICVTALAVLELINHDFLKKNIISKIIFVFIVYLKFTFHLDT